jgi:hypothetical protein
VQRTLQQGTVFFISSYRLEKSITNLDFLLTTNTCFLKLKSLFFKLVKKS